MIDKLFTKASNVNVGTEMAADPGNGIATANVFAKLPMFLTIDTGVPSAFSAYL
jgi:hypothetical protein